MPLNRQFACLLLHNTKVVNKTVALIVIKAD